MIYQDIHKQKDEITTSPSLERWGQVYKPKVLMLAVVSPAYTSPRMHGMHITIVIHDTTTFINRLGISTGTPKNVNTDGAM